MTDNYLSDYFVAYGDYCVASSYDVASFCRRYIGVVLHTIPPEQEVELAMTDEFKEMHSYPSKDSIKRINGVWVIKWNEVE